MKTKKPISPKRQTTRSRSAKHRISVNPLAALDHCSELFGHDVLRFILEAGENSAQYCTDRFGKQRPAHIQVIVAHRTVTIIDNGDGIDSKQFDEIFNSQQKVRLNYRKNYGCGVRLAAYGCGELALESNRNGRKCKWNFPSKQRRVVDYSPEESHTDHPNGTILRLRVFDGVPIPSAADIRTYLSIWMAPKLQQNTVLVNRQRLDPYLDARPKQEVYTAVLPPGLVTSFGQGSLRIVYSQSRIPNERECGISYQFAGHCHDHGYPGQLRNGSDFKRYLTGALITEKNPIDPLHDFVTMARNGLNEDHPEVRALLQWSNLQLETFIQQLEPQHKGLENTKENLKAAAELHKFGQALAPLVQDILKGIGEERKKNKVYLLKKRGDTIAPNDAGIPILNGSRRPCGGGGGGGGDGTRLDARLKGISDPNGKVAKLVRKITQVGLDVMLVEIEPGPHSFRAKYSPSESVIRVNTADPAIKKQKPGVGRYAVMKEVAIQEMAVQFAFAERKQPDVEGVRDWSRRLAALASNL